MAFTIEQAEAGHAVYSPATLRIYDFLVLRISNRWIWKCPSRQLLTFYNQHVTANHLDVGVGTGYFLKRCRFPSESPRVALLDRNPHCLAAAAAQIAHYSPEQYQANILEPLQLDTPKFDSISLNYVLHCLPGTMAEKSCALSHLAQWLQPGGVLFGATLLHAGIRRNWAARRLMNYYNRKQIISNQNDDLAALQDALAERFTTFELRVVGCAALFVAQTQ